MLLFGNAGFVDLDVLAVPTQLLLIVAVTKDQSVVWNSKVNLLLTNLATHVQPVDYRVLVEIQFTHDMLIVKIESPHVEQLKRHRQSQIRIFKE
jgi:hypothetical protein